MGNLAFRIGCFHPMYTETYELCKSQICTRLGRNIGREFGNFGRIFAGEEKRHDRLDIEAKLINRRVC